MKEINSELHIIATRYLDDTYLASLMEEGETVYVDDYVQEFINNQLEDKSEDELEEIIRVIEKFASFYSRLRVEVNNLLGDVILERMMDEADREAEEGYVSDNEHGLIRLDAEDSADLSRRFKYKSEEE